MQLGGSSYDVLLGRRDATTASRDAANANIPAPFLDLPDLIANFKSHGLGLEDLVVLSGAHTLGFSRCVVYRNRIYNETSTIDGDFAASIRAVCPPSGDDDSLSPLDESPASFDTAYYQDLVERKGLLHSDQQLFKGDGSLADELVQKFSENSDAFWAAFGVAMII